MHTLHQRFPLAKPTDTEPCQERVRSNIFERMSAVGRQISQLFYCVVSFFRFRKYHKKYDQTVSDTRNKETSENNCYVISETYNRTFSAETYVTASTPYNLSEDNVNQTVSLQVTLNRTGSESHSAQGSFFNKLILTVSKIEFEEEQNICTLNVAELDSASRNKKIPAEAPFSYKNHGVENIPVCLSDGRGKIMCSTNSSTTGHGKRRCSTDSSTDGRSKIMCSTASSNVTSCMFFHELQGGEVLNDTPRSDMNTVLGDTSRSDIDTALGDPSRSDMNTTLGDPTCSDMDTVPGDPSRSDMDTVLGDPSRSDMDTALSDPSRSDMDTVLGDPSRSDMDTVLGDPFRSDMDTVLGDPFRSDMDTTLGDPTRFDMDTALGDPTRSDMDTVHSDPSRSDEDSVLGDPSRSDMDSALGDPSCSDMDTTLGDPTRSDMDTSKIYPSLGRTTDISISSLITSQTTLQSCSNQRQSPKGLEFDTRFTIIRKASVIRLNRVQPTKAKRVLRMSSEMAHLNKSNTKVVKMLLTVVACYIGCWSLNEVIFILNRCGVPCYSVPYLYNVSVFLVCLHCCINPFIYTIQYADFQNGVKYIVCEIRTILSAVCKLK